MVMEVSPRPTISRLMRTCHTLYCCGLRTLIGSSRVPIRTNEEAISFLRFMLADPGSRFPHLRNLEIARGNFSRSGAHALRGLLRHQLLALETLTLRDAEAVLLSDATDVSDPSDPHNLFTAIAWLESLKNLAIDGCGWMTLDIYDGFP